MKLSELINKVANNMLEFLIDPTVFPPERRLYFRPEEILDNSVFEEAKRDAERAYGDQRQNSDLYPNRPLYREASLMERKTIIASLDVLSQQFNESDPIAADLRTMAYAVSKMSEEEFNNRVEAKKKVEMIKCPKCGANVMKQTGYCLRCKKKISEMKKAEESEDKTAGKIKGPGIPDGTGPNPQCPMKEEDSEKKAFDFWSREAEEAICRNLIAEVCGCEEKEEETPPKPAKKAVKVEEKKEEIVSESEKKAEEKKKETALESEEEAKEEKKALETEKEAEEKKEEEVSEPEKKAECGKPHKEEKEEEKEATEVDTDFLLTGFDGIEMHAGLITEDDLGELSESEQKRLSQLFE